MSYCHTNVIAIRTGGVFDGECEMDFLRKAIQETYDSLDKIKINHPEKSDLDRYLSKELFGGKGSVVVLGGVFNHWYFEYVCEFAKALSAKLNTDVLVSSLDNEMGIFSSESFTSGKLTWDSSPGIIGRI